MNRQGTTTGPGPTLCAEPVCVNPSFSSSSQPAVVVASATDASDTDQGRRLMCTDNLRSQAPANQCRLKGEQHGSNCVPGLHVNGASSRAPSSLLDAVSHRPGRRRSPVAPPEFEPPPRPDQPAATPGRRLAPRREGRAAHPSPTVSAKATLGSAVPTFEATRAASCAALPFPQRYVPPSISAPARALCLNLGCRTQTQGSARPRLPPSSAPTNLLTHSSRPPLELTC